MVLIRICASKFGDLTTDITPMKEIKGAENHDKVK